VGGGERVAEALAPLAESGVRVEPVGPPAQLALSF
jgi:hypothetical protein